MTANLIPIERLLSCVHLSEVHQKHLFGENDELQILKPRSGMKGQFFYKETVRVLGQKGTSLQVAISGPAWEETSLQLTAPDMKLLGITNTVTLQGPSGVVKLKEGIVVPQSSLCCSREEAERLHVAQGDVVEVCLADQPTVVFDQVVVRVHPTYTCVVHVSSVDDSSSKVSSGMMAQLVIS